MKGRTHRLQSADPQDDWVDGSWTVDCVCGVNFDDGEEMVNCDECGVWVHTRCSRYTKGDESFACDKCKSNSSRNDNEETEVAQLLVELPTKTVRMGSSFVAHVPPPHSFRLWTDVPMEERVHVQGVPGGDPALFRGLSGIFTRELWNCTGYVPKKFNFQYREFPCWDDDTKNHKKNEVEGGNGNENLVDNGAGVLFSLSKERTFDSPVFRRKEVLKEVKQSEDDGRTGRRSQFGFKKDRDLLHPIVVRSSKPKNDTVGVSKDRSGRRSRTAIEKETDEKKRISLASKAVCRPTCDGKSFEYCEGRGAHYCNTDVHTNKSNNMKDNAQGCTSDVRFVLQDGIQNPSINQEHSSEASPPHPSGGRLRVGTQLKEEKAYRSSPTAVKSPLRTGSTFGSTIEHIDDVSMSIAVKEEGDNTGGTQMDGSVNCSLRSCHDLSVKGVAPTDLEVKNGQILEDTNAGICKSLAHSNGKVKVEVHDIYRDGVLSSDAKDPKTLVNNISANFIINASVGKLSQLCGDKVQVVDRTSGMVMDSFNDKIDELPVESGPLDQTSEASQSFESVQNNFSELKHVFGFAKEPSKLGESLMNSKAASHHLKDEACAGRSLSCPPSTAMAISSTPENPNHTDSDSSAKQPAISGCNVNTEGDLAANGVLRDEDKYDLPQKMMKERQTSVSSTSKGLHQNRVSQSYSKKFVSESKDCVPYASSRVCSMQNMSGSSGSAESSELLQNQCSSHARQSRGSGHDFMPKAEKFNQSNAHPSKASNASLTNPYALSNCPAALSDEELALLLHQELNSSPRVPRVPRVRHTGSFPQLASSTAMSTLIKRTSSPGGKDQNLMSRRKHKDASREHDDGAKKIEKMASPLDHKRQDGGYALDASKIRENKNLPPVSRTNGGPSSFTEANDQKLSSVHNSPNNISDDDGGTVRVLVPRTLPGLINDIMSKGRRMTYDELCNAVLPHWPNLRKHNGERYAYSSHTQAVLDCLRNRHEWAQLVDRGPKTNSTKRRRKVDAEDSEENEYSRGRASKEAESKSFESQRDDFPKGKRKARKRRRWSLQIRDAQRRRKADFSDDENELFSNSSGEGMFSDDEIEGGEASASSDELGTM